MTEFAKCPSLHCQAKVIVQDGDMVNVCCVNCWSWFWQNGVMNQVPTGPDGRELPLHSEQCDKRQMSRIHEPIVDRDVTLATYVEKPRR